MLQLICRPLYFGGYQMSYMGSWIEPPSFLEGGSDPMSLEWRRQGSLASRPFFAMEGKIVPWTANRWNVVRLHYVDDVIHGNNGDQANEAVCRRLGYTSVNLDHEKAVRCSMNGWDAFASFLNQQWKVWTQYDYSRTFLSLTEVFSFQKLLWFAFRTSKEDSFCNEISQDIVIMCQSSATPYVMSYIMVLQTLRYRRALRNGGYCGTAAVSQLFSNDECWHGNSTACTTQMFMCNTLRTTIVTFRDQSPDKLNYN